MSDQNKYLTPRRPIKDSIQVDPELVTTYDFEDRSNWEYSFYLSALEEASKLKIYSQWMLGMLAYEVEQKFFAKNMTVQQRTELAKEANIATETLYRYKLTYETYRRYDEEFVPDGFINWSVIEMIAKKARKKRAQLDDFNPVDKIKDLQDKGVRSGKHAYRELKQEETGIIAPPKPSATFKFNEKNGKYTLYLNDERLEQIDWDHFIRRYGDYL